MFDICKFLSLSALGQDLSGNEILPIKWDICQILETRAVSRILHSTDSKTRARMM